MNRREKVPHFYKCKPEGVGNDFKYHSYAFFICQLQFLAPLMGVKQERRIKTMEQQNNIQNNPTEGDTQPTGEKTFTQDDVNRIISKRLAEEKSKGEAEFSKREQELEQKELNFKAREVFSEKKLPEELINILKFSDEKTLNDAVQIVEKVFKMKEESPKPVLRGTPPYDGPTASGDMVRKAMGLQ